MFQPMLYVALRISTEEGVSNDRNVFGVGIFSSYSKYKLE